MKNIKRCEKCVLPETFPGISFNEQGVCNHCTTYRGTSKAEELKSKYESKFLSLLEVHRDRADYDVLMAYSGGKDSTYTLDLFVNKYGMRVLALSFDNTFISERSFANMRVVCSSLGVDHMIVRPSAKMLRAIFKEASESELYSAKTLERASTICTSCIGLVKALILKTALEKQIPFVGFGWSPGQAPVQSSVMKTNASMARATQKAIQEPLRRLVGAAVDALFVSDEQFSTSKSFPWNIHPLAFLDYDERLIIERNRELGWEKPDDTDANSTNCLLNSFANHVHKERYGFHPYVWEIANMVRGGAMSRSEGLEKIEATEDPNLVKATRHRLFEQATPNG